MLRFIVRLFGVVLLACAFAALIVDGTRSLGSDTLVVTSIGEALTTFQPGRLAALEAAARGVSPVLWPAMSATILRLPIWFACGVVGVGLFALAGRRRIPVGFSSR